MTSAPTHIAAAPAARQGPVIGRTFHDKTKLAEASRAAPTTISN